MNLQHLVRVVSRFKIVVVLGVVLAVALAFLAYFRVTFQGGIHLSNRGHEEWKSSSSVLLTGHGFDWGSTLGGPNSNNDTIEARLPGLAAIYANFFSGDGVQGILRRSGPVNGLVGAAPAIGGPTNNTPLPVIQIVAFAYTPRDAIMLANRGANALRMYVGEQQQKYSVALSQRVLLRPLQLAGSPNTTFLIKPRSKTPSLVVFITVLFATLGLVLLLENMRPRVRAVSEKPAAHPDNAVDVAHASRRSDGAPDVVHATRLTDSAADVFQSPRRVSS